MYLGFVSFLYPISSHKLSLLSCNDLIPEQPGPDEDDFLGSLEGLTYTVGFKTMYEMMEEVPVPGHSANHYLCINRVTAMLARVKVYDVLRWERAAIRFLRNEVTVLSKLREESHPVIPKILHLFADHNPRRVLVVAELAGAIELFSLIVRLQKLSEPQTRTIFVQLLSAMDFLVSCPLLTALSHEAQAYNN
jgi:serine/threonine protein kinase